MVGAGVLTESRGTGGDATYTRVEQLVEAGANRAGGREISSSLAPENEPPLASVEDMIRQVIPTSCCHCMAVSTEPAGGSCCRRLIMSCGFTLLSHFTVENKHSTVRHCLYHVYTAPAVSSKLCQLDKMLKHHACGIPYCPSALLLTVECHIDSSHVSEAQCRVTDVRSYT